MNDVFKHVLPDKVDRPLRRAMLIDMRLGRLVLASSKGLLDPPRGAQIDNNKIEK